MGFLKRRSAKGRDAAGEAGAHDRAHEMIAHIQVLIATSSEVAIPSYLHDKSTSDMVEAVGICDNLLEDSEDPTSMYQVATGQAREAFLQEIKRR